MIFFLSLVVIFTLAFYLYMRQDKFGKSGSKIKLTEFKKLSNYKNGKFQNLSFTPQLADGYSMSGVLYTFLFKRNPRRAPSGLIPTVKNDLLNLPVDKNILVWFGHSSYFMQVDRKTFLVDPVFSGNASPLPGTNKSFKGTDLYDVSDLPYIDFLFITHDHYDHLDHDTIVKIKDKVGKVICGLGVGSHLEHWGYPTEIIAEKNWYEKEELGNGFTIYCEPARHFSGRGFSRNITLWVSFLLQTPSMKIFIGGDSGYDAHFAKIGKKHGPIDLAILENGQYDKAWQMIHALPNEVLQAAADLNAKQLLPVHSGKFVMANHAWDDPLKTITELNKEKNIPIITPVIGEIVNLKDTTQQFKSWWVGID